MCAVDLVLEQSHVITNCESSRLNWERLTAHVADDWYNFITSEMTPAGHSKVSTTNQRDLV